MNIKKIGCLLLLLTGWTLHTNAQKTTSQVAEFSRQTEILTQVLLSLENYYVDSLCYDSIMTKAINAVLDNMDPFTEYYPNEEESDDDLQMLTTGEYAGIGAETNYLPKMKRVTIRLPYAGFPAATAGLRYGDILMKIDGKDTYELNSTKVSKMLRGTPGSTVTVEVQRAGTKGNITKQIKRALIRVPSVSHTCTIKDKIGYIKLDNFTNGCADEMRKAATQMKNDGVKALILDLRDNPGGSLSEAIDIVGLFLPSGTKVLAKKGRAETANDVFYTKKSPLLPNIPLCILVNDGSASASEITSGTMQDLDRAVIVGTRTYGKGLVQQLRSLPYNATLKLTTSRYLIPSGRCIQAYDFKHRNVDGSASRIADSLTHVFHTANGRIVRDGGGVLPDVVVESDSLPSFIYYLMNSEELQEFVALYRSKHSTIAPAKNFNMSDADLEELRIFLNEKKFTYPSIYKNMLKQLRLWAKLNDSDEKTFTLMDSLEHQLEHNVDTDIKRHAVEVKQYVSAEIVSAYYLRQGAQEYMLRFDPTLDEAIKVLNDSTRYTNLLKPQLDEQNNNAIQPQNNEALTDKKQ